MSLLLPTAENLEQVFRHIHQTRMQGLPILNESVKVQAVGFRPWQDNRVGVLITPWFMNLMLLHVSGDHWRDLPLGQVVEVTFPSRTYRFRVNALEGMEACLSHSLHSPMFRFASQQEAVQQAADIMAGLDVAVQTMHDPEADALDRYLRKESLFDTPPSLLPEETSPPPQAATAAQPLHRRDLLLGRFGKSREESVK